MNRVCGLGYEQSDRAVSCKTDSEADLSVGNMSELDVRDLLRCKLIQEASMLQFFSFA